MNSNLSRAFYVPFFVLCLFKVAGADSFASRSQSVAGEFSAVTLPMPPDPGEMGKATRLGIDSDANGVRDDVERYIIAKYDGAGHKQLALFQYATALQLMLADAEHKKKTSENAEQLSSARWCIEYVWSREDRNMELEVELHDLKSKMLNTTERLVAWFKASSQLSGTVTVVAIPTNEGMKASCAFLPHE